METPDRPRGIEQDERAFMSSLDVTGTAAVDKTRPTPPRGIADIALEHWFLIVGALALAIPTMISVAKLSWSTEQGAHGPIMLATGIWLIGQQKREVAALVRPGNPILSIVLLLVAL